MFTGIEVNFPCSCFYRSPVNLLLASGMETNPSLEIPVGWISVAVVLCGLVIYAVAFVSFYHHPQQTHWLHKVISILAIIVAVLPCTFLPVDVYLTSSLKNADGTFKPWAETEDERMSYLNPITDGYYGLFASVMLSLFFCIPFGFFFKPSGGLFSNSSYDAILKALKFVFFTAILCFLLFIVGLFLPLNGESTGSITERCRSSVFFIINVLCIIGFSLITTYLSYGTVSWPFGWIFGKYASESSLKTITERKESLERQLRNMGLASETPDQDSLQELKKEIEIINLKIEAAQSSGGIMHHALVKLRPLQVLYGMTVAVVGLMIFLSILLNNVDRAINSMGFRTGYYLKNHTLPNPLDFLLTHCHFLYPMDLIVLVCILHFFIFSTIEGLKAIGSRCLWIELFLLKPKKTPSHSLTFLCALLTLIVLALLPFIFQIAPQYCSFGSQMYQLPNQTGVLVCSNDAPEDLCIKTRFAMLTADFYKDGWIFGGIYYWLSWFYIIVAVLSPIIVLARIKYSSSTNPLEGSSEDDEDEPMIHA